VFATNAERLSYLGGKWKQEVQLTQEIFENRFHEFFQRNIAEKVCGRGR
jgi:hypothetical protein